MNRTSSQPGNYRFATNYKHDQSLRSALNNLTNATYGFDFENWYQDGYWGENYIPYSLFDGDKMISNVSVTIMELIVDDKPLKGVQIGTVMTDKDYRHQGLNRHLLEIVLDEWRDKSDFIHLFANDTVLDFYPKFGFERVQEYQHSKSISIQKGDSKVKKLNMDDTKVRQTVKDTIKRNIQRAKVSAIDNTSLIMFYSTLFMKDSIYYIEEYDAVVVAQIEDKVLSLLDVFSETPIDPLEIASAFSSHEIEKLVLGFTPLNDAGYTIERLGEDNDALFVLNGQSEIFGNHRYRFPILSHA